jgi:hypothetical protein
MMRAILIVSALLCLACVLMLCIAPFVDLPETVIRPFQSLLFVLLFMTTGLLFSSDMVATVFQIIFPGGRVSSPFRFLLRPIETTCVQQC